MIGVFEPIRRLVDERVRQATAAVANRGGAGEVGIHAARRGSVAGPKIDIGPGAERWRKAVGVAAEAVSSTAGVSEMVVLVTPKGNSRGRISLVDKVSIVSCLCFLFVRFLSCFVLVSAVGGQVWCRNLDGVRTGKGSMKR